MFAIAFVIQGSPGDQGAAGPSGPSGPKVRIFRAYY